MLDVLGVPYVLTHDDMVKAYGVHKCLQHHPDYQPVLHPSVEQTTRHILAEANRLMPGWVIRSRHNSLYNVEGYIRAANDNDLYMVRTLSDNVYYPGPNEVLMDIEPLSRLQTHPEYPVLFNAVALLFKLGLDDVVQFSNNSIDLNYQYEESFYYDILEEVKDEMRKEGVDFDKDDKGIFEAKAEKRAKVIAKEELEWYEKVVEASNTALDRHEVDFLLLHDRSFIDDSIGRWVRHLLMMHNRGFNFRHYILDDNEYEDCHPVMADACIGCHWNVPHRVFKHFEMDIECYSNEYGFSAIGYAETLHSDGSYTLHKEQDDIPIMHWVRTALGFNLGALCSPYLVDILNDDTNGHTSISPT